MHITTPSNLVVSLMLCTGDGRAGELSEKKAHIKAAALAIVCALFKKAVNFCLYGNYMLVVSGVV